MEYGKYCPNKNLPDWKELVEVVGENKAYYLWMLNKGNALDKAPNGEFSILFQALMDNYGDKKKAIEAKAKVYTPEFKNWFGDWNLSTNEQHNDAVDYLFLINPKLEQIGTKTEYKQYINSIFPNSLVKDIYWHGTDSDFSNGMENVLKGKGSGAPETGSEMYFNKLPWASLQYITGVNRTTSDNEGYNNWVKLWWELKEALGNGRMDTDEWKYEVIGPNTRQYSPNKRGIFDRDKGGSHGKYLSERKARYGYENKSDKEFFEEVFGIRYGEDTFQSWVDRNASKFKDIWSSRKVKKGMYPAVVNVLNPIIEEGQNTYYEEQRGLFTKAKQNGNDAIISNKAKNEFGSDVIVIFNPKENVHLLGTNSDLNQFEQWKLNNSVSKVVDKNGEPLVVYHSSEGKFKADFDTFNTHIEGYDTAIYATDNLKMSESYIALDIEDVLPKRFNPYYGEDYTITIQLYYDDIRERFPNINFNVAYDELPSDVKLDSQVKNYYDALNAFDIESNFIYNLKKAKANKSKIIGYAYHGDWVLEIYGPNSHYTKALFVNLKNPKVINGNFHNWNNLNDEGTGRLSTRDIEDKYRKSQYDGIIFNNIRDTGSRSIKPIIGDVYAVYDSNNVKSIYNEGPFSTTDDNIYHHIESKDSVENTLQKKGLIHKFNGQWYMTKTFVRGIKSTDSEITSLYYNLKLESENMGYYVFSINNDPEKPLYFVKKELSDKIPYSPLYQHVRQIISFLLKRFPGLKFGKIVPQSEALPGQRAFIKGDTIYLVEGRFTDLISIEEALHPFVNTLFHTNKKLFDALYEEASRSYPKLKAEIEKNYSKFSNSDRKLELVAQALSREFKKIYDETTANKKERTISSIIRSFIDWLKSLFTIDVVRQYNNIHYVNTSELPKMTLEELANLINSTDSKFDVEFNGTFNNLSSTTEKTYAKILQGLKNRLESIKRYKTKNPKVWRQILLLIQQLSNSEAEQGILLFIEHINDTINESIQFLNQPIENINAKQIRQLSKDYVGFYKPLMDEIQYLLDTTDLFKDLDNYNEIIENFNVLSRQMDKVNNRFNNVLKAKGYSFLLDYLKMQGMPEEMILETIDWLDDPKHDTSIFTNWFGMASNSNNPVIQTIAKLLNDTKNETDRGSVEIGIGLVKLLNAAKSKYGSNVQKMLYEKLSDGTYSGYMIQDLNWGLMRKDLKLFLDDLAKKLNLEKDSNGQIVLPQDEDIQKKYFDAINEWYSKHANRKYKAEYYALRNQMLSMETRAALEEIQNSIDSLLDPVTTDGVAYENLLSESEYEQLVQLRKQKRLLANEFNIDGSIKTGKDAQIAKELREFNKALEGKLIYTQDKARYNRDRKKVAERYGEGSKELLLWEKRNTKQQFSKEFYDLLKQIEGIELGEDYKQLSEIRRQVQSIYKDPHTGKTDVDKMSDLEKKQILELDIQLSKLRRSNDKEYAQRFNLIATITNTDLYYRDYQLAQLAGTEAFNKWFNDNHYEDSNGFVRPASYYTEFKPVDSKYIEIVPGDKYTTLDSNSELANKEWNPEGPAIQPNRKLYDNSKAYNEVMSKPEVKALFEEILRIMKLSNSYISFLSSDNSNKMPQISARLALALYRKDTLVGKIGYLLEDFVSTKEDDLDYIEQNTMPNGDPIRVIPTRFVKMLEDPNTISTDAVYAVMQYYNMALNYKNMSEKLDQIELMLNLLRNIQIHTKKGIKLEGSSNYYKLAQLLVDRLLYGRNRTPIETTVLGKKVNIAKMLDIVRGFITKVNLSGNIWSIGTSFFTDATYTTMEAKLGRFFDTNDLAFATKEFARQLPNMLENVGNADPKGKLPYLLLLNQVVKSNLETFDRLDLSQVLRAINLNFWFAGYTLADYTVKSHTLLSIYHNYRFVKGEGFMSKQQYIDKFYPNDRAKGEFNFKQLDITLYDAYIEDKKGNVSINKKYEQYITEKLLNDVRNRINILSKRIDGTLREVDKSMIHANSLASYIIMHKNFMILGLHDRFKKKQYNLDLGVVEEGYYRIFGKFISNLFKNRHALPLLLADYDNMKPYEQYAVKRVLYDMLLIAGSTTIAVALGSLVDGDDDYDNWIMQSVTYLAMRSAFEFRTMYNPMEFISMIKSPTAAVSWIDNASSFVNVFNPYSYFGDRTPFTIIDRGVYKGMPVIMRNMIKVTPFRSIFEAQDPETKRNYLQNQLMSF